MNNLSRRHAGFTIVEILIVIVVIAVLATIGTLSFRGVVEKAHDASVISDLKMFGETLSVKVKDNEKFPSDEASLSTMDLAVSENSYGGDLMSGDMHYNLLYCSTVPSYSPSNFAFVGSSKAGNVYVVTGNDGTVRSYPVSKWEGSGWGTICPDVLKVVADDSSEGVWLYENSIWKIWLK